MTERRRIGVVVDRYSASTFGGAPLFAHALARRLGDRFKTELLTTTAQNYMTWDNAYPAGEEQIDGVRVRRFAIDVRRDLPAFDRLSRRLVSGAMPSIAEQEQWMALQGPQSSALRTYLAGQRERYDAFIFVSYIYATTYDGLPLVADRAVLVPLAHDEWPMRFSMWDRFFTLPRALVYQTQEEREFTAARFPNADMGGPVIGLGITPPAHANGDRFRQRFGIDGPFALYLGRVDPSKGCDELIRAFRSYRAAEPNGRALVMVGERYMDVADDATLRLTGPVDEHTKWDALAACDVLVLPSRHESLSLAVLEAWTCKKPVLVNARAAPLVGQCRRSGGGLWYVDEHEFSAAIALLDAPTARVLGERGAAYVEATYRWETIVAAYDRFLHQTFGWTG